MLHMTLRRTWHPDDKSYPNFHASSAMSLFAYDMLTQTYHSNHLNAMILITLDILTHTCRVRRALKWHSAYQVTSFWIYNSMSSLIWELTSMISLCRVRLESLKQIPYVESNLEIVWIQWQCRVEFKHFVSGNFLPLSSLAQPQLRPSQRHDACYIPIQSWIQLQLSHSSNPPSLLAFDIMLHTTTCLTTSWHMTSWNLMLNAPSIHDGHKAIQCSIMAIS